jgi:hypothetical protein
MGGVTAPAVVQSIRRAESDCRLSREIQAVCSTA